MDRSRDLSDQTLRLESMRIDVGSCELHAMVGGEGPSLLLIPGWPQTWYAWRLVIPAFIDAGFKVVAVDPKGMGDSDRPSSDDRGSGYDTGSIAAELVALMQRLDCPRFRVAGHDVGMWIAYAMAADRPDAVVAAAMIDAIIPGLSDGPPLLGPAARNARSWHFGFNRAPWAIQAPLLAGGGCEAYVAWQFRTKAGRPDAIPPDVVARYQRAHVDDRMDAALAHYRAIDETMRQNAERRSRRLEMPVLGVGGELGVGDGVGAALRAVTSRLEEVTVPGVGHYVPEEAPDTLGSLLIDFFGRSPTSTART